LICHSIKRQESALALLYQSIYQSRDRGAAIVNIIITTIAHDSVLEPNHYEQHQVAASASYRLLKSTMPTLID